MPAAVLPHKDGMPVLPKPELDRYVFQVDLAWLMVESAGDAAI